MGLSNDLISQFAKITNDEKVDNNGSIVYGTAVEYEGKIYVKLDGSDLLTPIVTTTDIKAGERVTVMVKDHSATVTGNVSSPSASKDSVDKIESEVGVIGGQISEFEVIVADKVSTKVFEAEVARIDTLVSDNVYIKGELDANKATINDLTASNVTITGKLEAAEADISKLKVDKLSVEDANIKYATIENLEATNADIHNLEADYGEFKSLTTAKFTAVDASIENLETTKLSATDAEIKYANIDFANIGEAAIKNFYAKSGVIQDVVISNGQVTGTLVGVTIKGDLIEGGTVVADKLVIKGVDGLYYKLNTNGETVSSQQTEYNSLNGTIITAKSITAEKIAVDDLVAFDATIGGFKITSDAIYSGAKASADNSTTGVYLDSSGQMSLGDATNFLKYYKDQNGNFKLEISADSIAFGTEKKDVETAISDTADELRQTISDQSTSITSDCEKIIFEALNSYVQTNAGVVITSVTNYYLASSLSEGVTSATEGWSESIPTSSTEASNLWTKEVVTYSDESTIETTPILVATYESSNISSITEYYAANSNSEKPTTIIETTTENGEIIQNETDLEWGTSIPEMSASNVYLWHYETITFADNSTSNTTKRFIGTYRHSYLEFKEIVETQLSLMAGEIAMNFETTSATIEEVDGETQQKFTEIYKHFKFNENGLEISAGENTISLILDNDIISFQKNGEQFGWWDGIDFHTGNIVVKVNERAQFGNFAFVPRSDGSLSFLKVGD